LRTVEPRLIYIPVNSKDDPALYYIVNVLWYCVRVYGVIEESE